MYGYSCGNTGGCNFGWAGVGVIAVAALILIALGILF
jgi:hypothetical protein